MKKLFNLMMILAFCLSAAGIIQAQTDILITANSAGKVKLGMTVAETRKALSGFKLERTSDGDGVALIAVGQGENTIMTLYAGEEDREAKIDETAIIEFIEVWGKNFQTAESVKPGMKLSEVEKKYGKVKEIMMSEIESREFATFTNHPKGLQFRVMSEDATAGNYAEGENKSSAYTPNAYLFSIQVTGANPFDEDFKPDQNAYFSSTYTNLNSDCESSGGEEGGHVSTICRSIGGYRINYFDSAANLNFLVETFDGENSINLGSQPLSYDTKTRKVEWRLANGRPFAVIIRMNNFETNDEGIPGKITGEYLLVKGLQKFEHIDFEVDAKTKNANEEARKLADNGYKQKPSTENFKTMDVSDFNKKIAEAAAKNEAWVKLPTQVIAQWLPPFEEFGSRRIEMNSEFADVTNFLKVVVTDDKYADDSVRGERYWVEIKKDAQGVWQIVSAKRAWVCQQNRGHQDYSIAPCL